MPECDVAQSLSKSLAGEDDRGGGQRWVFTGGSEGKSQESQEDPVAWLAWFVFI